MRHAAGGTAEMVVKVDGRDLRFTNPDKVLYPAAGFTKRDVLEYYLRVARWLLPHLRNRPITLKRYPNGVGHQHFYEKDAPGFTPPWVSVFPVPRRHGGPDIRYIVINDRATLAWCVSLANLELHPFLHRVPATETPTSVVFDLDPGEGADVITCAMVAFELKAVLAGLGLAAFPKVSGSKGLQVYVPLNTPVTYDQTGAFARRLATSLERRHPALVVSDMAKNRRAEKVFIDWSQNASYKTTVGVYSLRGKRDQPFVSAPVTWDELSRAIKTRAAEPLYVMPEAMLRRLDNAGDLFRPVLRLRQRLPADVADVTPGRQHTFPHARRAPLPDAPRRSRQGAGGASSSNRRPRRRERS